MWLPKIGLLLLAICTSPGVSKEITHEHIKDAIISLVHLMRENADKLERHEMRERLLGDRLIKSINILTKRVSAIEGHKNHLNRIDDRIAGMEQQISQRDQRERIQMQKTADTIEGLNTRLEEWLTDMKDKISELNNPPATTEPPKSDENFQTILSKLNDTEASVAGQLAHIEYGLQIMGFKNENDTEIQADRIQTVQTEVRNIAARLGNMESALGIIQENSKKPEEPPKESVPDLRPAIQEQTRALANLEKLLEDTGNRIRDLPRMTEVQELHNKTQTSLQETKHSLEDVISRGVGGIDVRVRETKEEVMNSVGSLRTDLGNNVERVNKELRDISKGQSMMFTTADNVLDTKKNLEYGIHKILLEVVNASEAQTENINVAFNEKFDELIHTIMDNQTGALANLTTKIDDEIKPVWRQISFMHQQMKASEETLDKLYQQNAVYINSTTSTIDEMDSKVGGITNETTKLSENLNFLLGRLSVVAKEFNSVKNDLGKTLDNMKASFVEIEGKAKEVTHKGPHPVPEDHEEPEDNTNESNGKSDGPQIFDTPAE